VDSIGSETLSSPLHPLLHRVLSGRYELREVVGVGGMATVFRAWDRSLQREIAVKALHPQLTADDEFVERFQREARFAAQLSSHPNVVAIHDVGDDANFHYIVMELVEGCNLKEVIAAEAPLPVSHAFGLGEQIAGALDFAHGRGLVHRDIKPQNILVGPDDRVKVTDFGIAQAENVQHLTRPGVVLGTVPYLSPEQVTGGAVGPGSDLYSLGVVLYEMLTGRLPFTADTPMGVAMQHVQAEPLPLGADVPPSAAAVVLRALQKKPSERFASAAELREALRQADLAAGGATTVYHPLEKKTSVLAEPTEPGGHSRLRRASLLAPLLLLLAVGALGAWRLHDAGSNTHGAPARTAVPGRVTQPARTPALQHPSQPGRTPAARASPPARVANPPTATARQAPLPTAPPTAGPALLPPPPVHGHHRKQEEHGNSGKGKGKEEGDGKGKGNKSG
jgi:serine/threonine-protein kinase